MVEFGLLVKMRWVTGPSTRARHHFTKDELPFGRTVGVVDQRSNFPVRCIAPHAQAALLGPMGIRTKPYWGKSRRIGHRDQGKLSLTRRIDRKPGSARDQKESLRPLKHGASRCLNIDMVRSKPNLPLKEKDGRLVVHFELEGVALQSSEAETYLQIRSKFTDAGFARLDGRIARPTDPHGPSVLRPFTQRAPSPFA